MPPVRPWVTRTPVRPPLGQQRDMAIPKVEGERAPKARIEGGYEPITVTQLIMAWWAYQSRLIQKLDLRVWFACWELEIRRRLSDGRYRPSLAELKRLVGASSAKGQGGLGGSIRRLRALGLLRSCSKDGISFAESPDELRHEDLSGLWAMLNEVSGPGRRVPVPRRIIRRLAGGLSKARTATVIAHLIRCLFYRKGQGINATGCCKASWIAEVFGVTERSVHDARGFLIEEFGWLIPGECSQRVLNRDGLWVSINLEWGADAGDSPAADLLDGVETIPEPDSRDAVVAIPTTDPDVETPASLPEQPGQSGQGGQTSASGGDGFSPPPAISAGHFSGPLENKKPLRDLKNQKPASRPAACGGPAGVCTGDSSGGTPKLANILPEDLREITRLLVLHEQAIQRGLIGTGEADRLKFVAAAVHAQAMAKDPCRLFAWLIRSKRWEVITQADEDEACARLKRHARGSAPERRESSSPPSPSGLSADARLVERVLEVLRARGIHVDPFAAAQRSLDGWDRPRWDRAVEELRSRQSSREIPGVSSISAVLDRIGAAASGPRNHN